MSALSQTDVENKLAEYTDPYLSQNLIKAKAVKQIHITDQSLALDISLGYPSLTYQAEIKEQIQKVLAPLLGNRKLKLTISFQAEPHIGQKGIKAIPNIKNIIAVASGKGGVGKSTTAVNLAIALAQEGARVGILDADIYGPSQPLMLGATETPELKDKKTLLPIVRHGVQSMSIGYLVNESAPLVWRGPMVSTALQQLINDTLWDDLDYLFVDLPPGTGDIQLTLAQKIPVSGAVIVTTPQDLALLDARRACEMFRKVTIPVLGIIENMSTHVCSNCGQEEAIFGEGGGERMATQYDLDFLGSLPLDIQIREQADSGKPTVVSVPSSNIANTYHHIARSIAAKLALQTKDYSHKFPNIVVKNT